MSDLVGNPEDRVSRAAAESFYHMLETVKLCNMSTLISEIFKNFNEGFSHDVPNLIDTKCHSGMFYECEIHTF